MQESASFWADIKKLEEQLATSPDSYCFARLSEVYLKVGLVDDALHIAREGVSKHPGYLSGQRAFACACHAKGLNSEALRALTVVTGAMPEDVASQKLLGRLQEESGAQDAARQTFKTALEFAPEDVELRLQLESIERLLGIAATVVEDDGEDVIEDLEVLEELELFDEDQSGGEDDAYVQECAGELSATVEPHHDPLSTATLAELYVTQGFIVKALEIYQALHDANPTDLRIAERLAELELHATDASDGSAAGIEDVEEDGEISTSADMYSFDSGREPQLMPEEVPFLEAAVAGRNSTVPTHEIMKGSADTACATLDGWLENIRRIKSCR